MRPWPSTRVWATRSDTLGWPPHAMNRVGLASAWPRAQHLDDEGIAGRRHRPGPPVAARRSSVAVRSSPRPACCGRARKPPSTKRWRPSGRTSRTVTASSPPSDSSRAGSAVSAGLLAGGALEDPVGALRLRQGVQVQRGASRLARGSRSRRRWSPAISPRTWIGVLPEVEHLAADEVRTMGMRSVASVRASAWSCRAGRSGDRRSSTLSERAFWALTQASERLCAVDVLQPEGVSHGGSARWAAAAVTKERSLS